MLAQAQEVIYDKTVTEKKPKLAAKLVAGISQSYQSLVTYITSQKSISKYLDSNTPVMFALVQAKSKFFLASAQYQKVLLMDSTVQMGEILARLEIAKLESKEAFQLISTKFSKVQGHWEIVINPLEPMSNFVDQAKLLNQQVSELYSKLHKENDVIYHVQVMPKEALPSLESLILPEKLGFEQILPGGLVEIHSKIVDLFQKLIPMEIHEKNSLYSEKKSDVLRQVDALHQNFEQEFKHWLTQTDLYRQLETFGQTSIPSSTGLTHRTSEHSDPHFNELWDTFCSVSKNVLEEIQTLLSYVEQQVQLNVSLVDALKTNEGYQKVIQLKMKTEKQTTHFRTLKHELSQTVDAPSFSASTSVVSSNMEDGHLLDTDPVPDFKVLVKEIQSLLSKLKNLQLDRESLLKELKTKVMHDDIHELLILNRKQNIEHHIFEVELSKFQPLLDPIHSNLTASRTAFQACKDSWDRILAHPTLLQLKKSIEDEKQRSAKLQEIQVKEQQLKKSVGNYFNELIEDQSQLPTLKKKLEECVNLSKSSSEPRRASNEPLRAYNEPPSAYNEPSRAYNEPSKAQNEQHLLLQQLQRLQMTAPSSNPPPSSMSTPSMSNYQQAYPPPSFSAPYPSIAVYSSYPSTAPLSNSTHLTSNPPYPLPPPHFSEYSTVRPQPPPPRPTSYPLPSTYPQIYPPQPPSMYPPTTTAANVANNYGYPASGQPVSTSIPSGYIYGNPQNTTQR
ncbi:bck1-like resistance to osmotic shock [Coelomomyces lativittatus]|nr:bck1-like resistance to osmotic shock [Coelomomyces lativittatus]KAJ1515751.1 bck1-like resistance to osmotic shock [Coelomomyces lativittatus]